MTENRKPRLAPRADTDDSVGVTDDLQPAASWTLAPTDTECHGRGIVEEFCDSSSSSEVCPLMEDPDTPTKTSTHELEELRNESRTTVAQGDYSSSATQFESSPLPRSPNPSSKRSSPSLRTGSEWRALRDEQAQEQARVDYLQRVGLELASTRRSADHEQPGLSPLLDSSEDESLRPSLDSTRQALQKFKLCKKRRSAGHENPDVSTPSPTSLNSDASFRARRTREGANWFAGSRASKTLPPGFELRQGLAESSPSRNSGSLRGDSSRSASLRLRNNRLPPGYIQPHEQPLIVGSASVPDCEVVGKPVPTGHRLSLPPSLDASSERRTAAPLIPDPDEEADRCIPAPLSISQRSAPDLTIDTTMSGALPMSGEPSNRESRFCEVMKEVDGGARPNLPPKSPDRPSARNSALLSNRGSVVFPVPEPLPEQETPAVKPNSKELGKKPWVVNGVLATLWAIAFALTIFGVSKVSLLAHHPAACTLEQIQTCTPPSLSFVHEFRLNTTLPKALQPYLPLTQPSDVQDLIVTDGGVKITTPDDVSDLGVWGALDMDTWLQEMNLLSEVRYAGVIAGNVDSREAKQRLDKLMERHGQNHGGRDATFTSAQGASRHMSISSDGVSTARSFFAFWLGCLLAVELSFLFYSAIAMVRHYWLESDDDAKGEEKGWEREMLSASGLVLRVGLAGALGTAAASGVLIAFWT
ncbi:hypothetical protein E8E11_004305 [Didymella keratinophila]|nr:hypothetical protein E8E11_004305 [Didymella keratinophila]